MFSYWERIQAVQLAMLANVVEEVLHPDLSFRPHQTNGFHHCTVHVGGLRAEHMFEPDTGRRFAPVALFRSLA